VTKKAKTDAPQAVAVATATHIDPEEPEITLYTATTMTGWNVSITLEELGIPFTVKQVEVPRRAASFENEDVTAAEFLEVHPDGRIPAIVDHANGDYKLCEAGAIMLYLSERSGGKLLPQDIQARHEALQWLMFQVAGLGPIMAELIFFNRIAAPQGDKIPFCIERFSQEALRLLKKLERRLEENEYLMGEYSLVDIACWPYISIAFWGGISLATLPKLQAWVAKIKAREAVQRGTSVPTANPVEEVRKELQRIQKEKQEEEKKAQAEAEKKLKGKGGKGKGAAGRGTSLATAVGMGAGKGGGKGSAKGGAAMGMGTMGMPRGALGVGMGMGMNPMLNPVLTPLDLLAMNSMAGMTPMPGGMGFKF